MISSPSPTSSPASKTAMALKKASIVVLLALIAVSTIATCLAKEVEPELKQCRHQCKHQAQFSEEKQRKCEERCEDYYKHKKERESEQGRQQHRGGEKEGEIEPGSSARSKQLKECQKQCEGQAGSTQQKQICSKQCSERFKEKETEPGRRKKEGRNPWEEEEEEEEWGYGAEEEENNPYVFEQQHFVSKVETEHGRVSFLPRFTKRSNLFRGIENFRFGVLEANPQTFLVPSHLDADAILFIAAGRGTITLLKENSRRSINVEQGDIVRIPAGTPIYGTNRDENDRLYIIQLLQPVNRPGHFEAYHGAAGQNPESFYTAFSWGLLEAALQTDRSKLERLFGQQQQGPIVKASKEQIEALSSDSSRGDEEEGSIWPFGGETKGSRKSSPSFKFNIFNKRPSYSNQHGQLYEADKDDFKQLKDFDVALSFANITQGSMAGPYYNSKATKISMVLEGEGYMEMACPHLAKRSSPSSRYQGRQGRWSWPHGGQQQQEGQRYQQVRARLSQGTVYITPAGHPVAAVASRNSNLQIICFEVNAENNVKYALVGKRNIVSSMEKEAQELAFNFPSRDVERIFKSQNEEFFFPGPRSQHGRRGYSDE